MTEWLIRIPTVDEQFYLGAIMPELLCTGCQRGQHSPGGRCHQVKTIRSDGAQGTRMCDCETCLNEFNRIFWERS